MAGRRKAATLEVVHPDCAGIDIGKKAHYVGADPARFDEPVRNYGTSTGEPRAMAAFLGSCGVRTVAMEATGGTGSRRSRCWSGRVFEVHLDAELDVLARDGADDPPRTSSPG